MNSRDIRNKCGTTEFWLREMTAQLAEINESLQEIVSSRGQYALRDQFIERIAVALENKQ